MRIELGSIEEFVDELTADAQSVHRGIVRFRIDYVPEQDEAVTFAVRVWATALIRTQDGDYVLEFGAVAGSDGPDSDAGTVLAREMHQLVRDTAKQHGLQVRGGKIEVW